MANCKRSGCKLAKKVEELGEERKAWISKQAECESILRALPQLTKYKTAESTLREVDKIPVVDDGTLIKYQAAEKFLTSSNALLEQQQKRVRDIEIKLENLNPDLQIIAIGNEIDALKIRSGELIKILKI